MKFFLRKRTLLAALIITLFLGVAQKIDWQPVDLGGCPFCERKKAQLVHQGEYASVLATHKPAVFGHLLIIPNRHVEKFDELRQEEIGEIGALVHRVRDVYADRLQAFDYVLVQKNGRLAGQSVPHLHVHILPRTDQISSPEFIARYLLVALFKPLSSAEMKEYLEKFTF